VDRRGDDDGVGADGPKLAGPHMQRHRARRAPPGG
jgi:hypothetical protein